MSKGVGVVEETPWWLFVNSVRVVGGTMKPDQARAMAAGRLLAGGWIRDASDLLRLEVGLDPVGSIVIDAQIPPERARDTQAQRTHRRENGCGLLHFVACDPGALRQPRPLAVPSADEFPERFRILFAAAERASPIGGLHAAALMDATTQLESREDVSRHNAVDKAIGAALLSGRDPAAHGLLVTSRISAEIALKAARAGVSWVASRSIPTSLAVAIANVARMPLVARAPSPEATVIAPWQDGETAK